MTHTFDAKEALATLAVQSANIKGRLADAVIGAPGISMSTTQVSQVDLDIKDSDFDLLRSGLFTAGSTFRFQDERLEVAVVETGGTISPTLKIKARSKGVQILKREKGAKIWKDLSPTDLVKSTARRVGLGVVAQSSPSRAEIARTGADGTGEEAESMWALLRDLAAQEGYILFEARSTLYFGEPTWLMANAQQVWNLGFPDRPGKGAGDIYSMTIPVCRRSSNDEDDAVELSFTLPFSVGIQVRPGDAVNLTGMPSFTGTYLINSVDITLDGRTPVSVSAGTPIDPEPRDTAEDTVAVDLGVSDADLFGEGLPEYESDPQSTPAFGTGDLIWPTRGVITSDFGPRNGRQHKGIDIGGNNRQRIVAAADGVVRRAAYSGTYGWVVYLDHTTAGSPRISQLQTRYAHMYAKPRVSEQSYKRVQVAGGVWVDAPNGATRVTKGQTLGYVGSTGRSTGPHLHFEVRLRRTGTALDPRNYLSGLPLRVNTVPQGRVR